MNHEIVAPIRKTPARHTARLRANLPAPFSGLIPLTVEPDVGLDATLLGDLAELPHAVIAKGEPLVALRDPAAGECEHQADPDAAACEKPKRNRERPPDTSGIDPKGPCDEAQDGEPSPR